MSASERAVRPYHASFLAQGAVPLAGLASSRLELEWPAGGEDETTHLVQAFATEDEGVVYLDGTVAIGLLRAVGPGAARRVAERVLAEVAKARGLDVTLLAVVRDPALVGAEIAAPPSLEVQVEQDEVRFILPGPWSGKIRREVTGIAVGAKGVTFVRATSEDTVPWYRLAGCGLREQADGVYLVALAEGGEALASAPCMGTADDQWLASYLEAQALRRRETEAERAERTVREAELRRLLGAVDDGG